MAVGAAALLAVGGIGAAAAEPAPPTRVPGAFSVTNAAADTQAVEQLKADYCQNIDAKNWDGLRALLAEDVVVDTTGSAGPIIVGRDNFVGFLKLTLGSAQTHHQVFDPQITLTSATTAEVGWRMEDVLIFGDAVGVHGYGHYTDRYTKVGGKWVISYSKLTRTRLDLINPDGTVIEVDAPIEKVVEKVREALGI
ncbi:nuclear transport factor 2 family protein [Nocardia exalbida]|uniref:nuclear transport factor 2 family protein n=1 Tax=Nocardia exalbida TaxID=290231 RepID=UPI0002EAFBD6|nr:nuclear transport factor 2 family protein [Nocardia exalbida]